MLKQQLISSDKYGLKCPYLMNPIGICIHNTANDACAANEILYMKNNNYEVSFHIAVDDDEAIQGIPLNRNAWAAGDGNGEGNRKYIHIEICYSKSGGDKFTKAEQRAAKEVALLLEQYGWGIDRIKAHRDFANKNCPHRTDMNKFKLMVENEFNGDESNIINAVAANKEILDPDVNYQVHTQKHGWLPYVRNLEDYAGVYGTPIDGIKINPTPGTIKYRAHLLDGNWLPWVANLEDYAGIYGNSIDGIQMVTADMPHNSIEYRAYIGGNWLPWVRSDYDYAGIYGTPITGLQIKII